MSTEHFDVLIIGAGLSGIDAGWHLNKFAPKKSYVILENRERIGGTWDLFRYPGIRSDSDMLTMGYRFKPWTHQSTISPGHAIREYVTETAKEAGVDRHIRFRHNVSSAAWDSATARWTIQARKRDDSGKEVPVTYTANFLFSCAGYYRYSAGYTPEFAGRDRFRGTVIHPQVWPEGFNYDGKRVVIIGSGATAVTLLPNMAKTAAHVTMLQRSPTYYVSRPEKDWLANNLRKILPATWAYALPRWRNIVLQRFFYSKSRTNPKGVKNFLINGVKALLPKDFDVEKHFTPTYNPWDQRLCLVPDADMFNAISSGRASVVTDHIDTFTEKGILLKSGKELEADVIVTATGLQVQMLGGISVSVDGKPVEWGKTFTYKGLMFSGVPNLANIFGYTNASWTLRADLVCEWVTRLLNRMDEKGAQIAVPQLTDRNMKADPWLDFSSGYVLRAIDQLPKQGPDAPWKQNQDYFADIKELRKAPIEDGVLQLTAASQEAVAELARAAE
jgi:cation diffusion facilitator CzcD-associated flavoprotein CzcO